MASSTIQLQRTVNLAQQFLRQSPLTFSAVGNISIGNAAGINYAVGDLVYLPGGLGGVAAVTSQTAGAVTGLVLRSGGQGYFSALTNSATTSNGSGTGLTVNTITTYNDPAFSNADWVMQFILSPPFAWRWNRTSLGSPTNSAFTAVIGQTDYKVSIPTFGWLEKATGYDPDEGYRPFELKVELIKAIESKPNQPTTISTQVDDGAGNITFRLFPPPNKTYTFSLEYQNAAVLFTSLTQTWSPIPDYLSYLFNTGFFAKSAEYANDPRYPQAMQMFMQDLVANSEGLTSSEKNIWLEDRLITLRQTQAAQQGR